MQRYMRDQFEFYGIKSGPRKELTKAFMKEARPLDWDNKKQLVNFLWDQPQREWQYVAMDLLKRNKKRVEEPDINWLEQLITTKSWWDTVDFLASHPVGVYVDKFSGSGVSTMKKWAADRNLWLRRSAILHQLNFKTRTDTELLYWIIERNVADDDFFIKKAIGWALRQYGRIDPEWVMQSVTKLNIKDLSRKEALRNLRSNS